MRTTKGKCFNCGKESNIWIGFGSGRNSDEGKTIWGAFHCDNSICEEITIKGKEKARKEYYENKGQPVSKTVQA